MTNEELKYKAELYVAVEFYFLWGRYLQYCCFAHVDGENGGPPKMSLDDYIEYKKNEYWKLSFLSVKEVENTIFNDVIQYYGNNNNPDFQREIHRRIYNAIINDLIKAQYDLSPELRQIYDSPRYVITPFKNKGDEHSSEKIHSAARHWAYI